MSHGAAIVLSAGLSTRFGTDKRLSEIDGTPLIVAILSKYLTVFAKVCAVIRPNDSVIEHLPSECEVVEAANASQGMSQSIAAGIQSLASEQWAVIALGDMPFVSTNTLDLLNHSLQSTSSGIVRLRSGNRFGNPVGFKSEFFEMLTKLEGDVGAKSILDRHGSATHVVDVDDIGIFQDIDTPQELRRLTRPAQS